MPKYPMPPTLDNKFTKVKEAREMLRSKAAEILEAYLLNATAAQAAGEFEVAAKSLQWLLEHMPKDSGSSEALVDTSVDKVAKTDGRKGNFGVQIMLAPTAPIPKALPKAIEAEVVEDEDADTE